MWGGELPLTAFRNTSAAKEFVLFVTDDGIHYNLKSLFVKVPSQLHHQKRVL